MENERTRRKDSVKGPLIAAVASIIVALIGLVPLLVGRSLEKDSGKNILQVYFDGIKQIAAPSAQSATQIPAATSPVTSPVVPTTRADSNPDACSGLEPWIKVEKVSVSPIKDGYSLTFILRAKQLISLSYQNPNHLNDDQKNNLTLSQTNLPIRSTAYTDEGAAKILFTTGMRIDPGVSGSIAYTFVGIGEGKQGAKVTMSANLAYVLKEEEKFTLAQTTLTCADLVVR